MDRDGNLFVTQYGTRSDSWIRRLGAKTGIITTLAGVPKAGLIGDGLTIRSVNLRFPSTLLSDPMGNLYLVDGEVNRVRRIDAKTQIIKLDSEAASTSQNSETTEFDE